MSRSYRISVKESQKRVLKAHDRVSTQLEILEVLPGDQMADLLREELKGRGFKERSGQLVREADGVVVSVDPRTGTVTVAAESQKQVELESQREGTAWDDVG